MMNKFFTSCALLFASNLILSACSRENKRLPLPVMPDETRPTLNLGLSEDRRTDSEFCGKVTPDKPQDPTPSYRFESTFLDSKLRSEGLTGWMHGTAHPNDQYVFTYRKEDPDDFMAFFKAEQFTLVPLNDEVARVLKAINRHDKVRIKGYYWNNLSPISHIKVDTIEVIKPYETRISNKYQMDTSIFKDKESASIVGVVHAISTSASFGQALILEYKDLILPIALNDHDKLVADSLYRGDIVQISVKILKRQQGPLHLVSSSEPGKTSLHVIDSMLNCHGQQREIVGNLVLFPKSPAISSDVYAVRVEDANQMVRHFTFFPNPKDESQFLALFKEISSKSKQAWEAYIHLAEPVRNFYQNVRIKVKATGMINVVSVEQANHKFTLIQRVILSFSTHHNCLNQDFLTLRHRAETEGYPLYFVFLSIPAE